MKFRNEKSEPLIPKAKYAILQLQPPLATTLTHKAMLSGLSSCGDHCQNSNGLQLLAGLECRQASALEVNVPVEGIWGGFCEYACWSKAKIGELSWYRFQATDL